MALSHDQLTVLYTIQRSNHSVSGSRLFSMLPTKLHELWSERHFIDGVLHELIREGYVKTRQMGPAQFHYTLTKKGQTEVEG